jgi:TolB protein
MNADGTGPVNLTNEPNANDGPLSWSPDGMKIAFVSDRSGSGNLEIYLANADGTNPINVTNHPKRDASPAWSPIAEVTNSVIEIMSWGRIKAGAR